MKLISPYTIACKNVSSTSISSESQTQLCSCDFRINLYDCPESQLLLISNWVLISYCGLLSLTAAASLWYLIKYKDQAFFLPSRRDRGKIKPRPQHIYFTMCLTYCPFQIIHSILLITNSYPNILWAEFGHTLPIALTTMVAVLYPLSIVYSISAFEVGTNFASARPISMSSIISEVPITKNAIKTDLACIFTMIMTFCIFSTVAVLTGYYADINDITKAINLFLIQNLVWAIWGFLYIIMMIWFWFRFINIVLENINDLTNQHQTQSSELQTKLEQLRKGTRNLSLPVYGQIITVLIYIPGLILYGLYHRSNTIFNYKINLLYMSIWYFTFPLILHVTQWIMVYNIVTTPSSNSVKNSNSKNNNSEMKSNIKTLNNEKRTSNNNNKINESTGISISEYDEEETYSSYAIQPKRESRNSRNSRIRYSGQDIIVNNNDENGKSNGGIITKPNNKGSLNPNEKKRDSNSYSSQTIASDTSTLFSNNRPISPISPISPTYTITNFTSSRPTSPLFSSSAPSSPSSPSPTNFPIVSIQHRDSITSHRESINSIASNGSNNSTTSSSNQRKEWLTRKPTTTTNRNRPTFRDSYKSSL